MKIAEVREKLERYSDKELRIIIAEMYKAIPKAIKEDKDIDALINNPLNADKTGKTRKQKSPPPDMEVIEYETKEFIETTMKRDLVWFPYHNFKKYRLKT